MNRGTFLAFVAPSFAVMLVLIALPLVGVVYLAVHNSYVKRELVQVTTKVPLFGGQSRTETRLVPQPAKDENGRPIQVWEFVGAKHLADAVDAPGLAGIVADRRQFDSLPKMLAGLYAEVSNNDFWRALEFTLLYTFATTPAILILGLALALAIDQSTPSLKSTLVFVNLLPTLVTPIVSSLAIYWLFLDDAIVARIIESLGLGKFYFLADQITIRTLIILHGIWYATPFAFIIFYAGLQTLPREQIEAAMIDGAGSWQRLRYVVVPFLAPLFVVITLIHMMDAYRVFEPILVFGSSVFANSLQYLTYYALAYEDNIHRAAAYALLTLFGILILLAPVLRRTWREQRGVA